MKQILSPIMFGIGALFFVGFFTTLKPTAVTAASGSGEPSQCSTKAPALLACRSLTFTTALWLDIARQN